MNLEEECDKQNLIYNHISCHNLNNLVREGLTDPNNIHLSNGKIVRVHTRDGIVLITVPLQVKNLSEL
tara:strand:+ start:140 stop:343 length:204 start_codon:yes stop_codon:yes gene_type:complete